MRIASLSSGHAPQGRTVSPVMAWNAPERLVRPKPMALRPVSSGLLKIYFGAQVINTPPEVQHAVDWYHGVNPIPRLDPHDRRNHRVHLAMTGEILGLLPKVTDAMAAYRQYVDVFDAVEAKPASGKKDYRMISYDKFVPVNPGEYLVRQYGYHVLVFAPNGAVESFRKVTPPCVEMDGTTVTDYSQRLLHFNLTRMDAEDVVKNLTTPVTAIPAPLGDATQYTRSIFKTSAQGHDAWEQPADTLADATGNASAYQAFSCQYP